ncbi:hypothetical protein MBANPS3_011261 [Mucor bainieri]
MHCQKSAKKPSSYLLDAIKYYKTESTVKSFKSAFEYQCDEAKIAELKTTSSHKELISALTAQGNPRSADQGNPQNADQGNPQNADQGELDSEDDYIEEDELDFEDGERYYGDDYSEEDELTSDLSINHHPLRRSSYSLVLEAKSVNFFDEDDDGSDDEDITWIVNGINVIQECRD